MKGGMERQRESERETKREGERERKREGEREKEGGRESVTRGDWEGDRILSMLRCSRL